MAFVAQSKINAVHASVAFSACFPAFLHSAILAKENFRSHQIFVPKRASCKLKSIGIVRNRVADRLPEVVCNESRPGQVQSRRFSLSGERRKVAFLIRVFASDKCEDCGLRQALGDRPKKDYAFVLGTGRRLRSSSMTE